MKSKWIAVALVLLVAPLLLVAGCGGGANGTAQVGSADTVGAIPPGWQARHPIIVRGPATDVLSGYSPKQIRHAYGFDMLSADGSGQTVAIVDAFGSPTIAADLATFSTQVGLPAATLKIATPQGTPTVDAGWAVETALDVEWVHAIAPQAKILLVECKSSSFADMFAGVAYGAQRASQVSMSWGGSEFVGEGAALKSFFNRSGVTYIASAGDDGGLPQIPCALPHVLGVGGTTLNLGGNGTFKSETAWSGSNGGPSIDIPTPAWQKQWNSTSMRECPDVSCVADPATGVRVYTTTGGTGWLVVGGTSLSAPIVAAMMALVNEGRSTPLSGTNAAIYALGSPTSFTTYFRDVTVGSNDNFPSGVGYDQVTGIGSPRVRLLAPALTSRP